MGVQRLPLPMAPGIRSALALAGLAPGMDVRRNFRSRGAITTRRPRVSSIDMYNNDVGQESAQKFMKQTGDLKAATLYFAS
jgi:hypothetical protein